MIAEKLIKEEIRLWSSEVLEKPSENYSGLPPCPYAKKAWANEKVRVHVGPDLDFAVRIKENNPPEKDSVDVFAWTGWDKMSAKDFDTWLDSQNEDHKGIWIIGFHPDHPSDDNLDEFEGNGSPVYGMILIQPLADLSAASKKILTKGYYAKYTPSDMNHVSWRNAQ